MSKKRTDAAAPGTGRRRWLVVSTALMALCLFVGASIAAQDEVSYSHEPVKIGKKKIVVGKGRKAKKIDNVSEYCLGCHDEDVRTGGAPVPVHSVGSAENSHPTDILYPAEKSGYKSAEKFDPRLVLRQGRMSCITCHDIENSRHELVISAAGSELCIACHQN